MWPRRVPARATRSDLVTIHLRVLTPADQPKWRALRLEALERNPAAFLTTAEEQRNRPASEDRAQLALGNWRGLFLNEDVLIGLAALIPFRHLAAAHRIEMGAVYVAEGHQGSGAGQAMMDALLKEAQTRGALQIELSVAANNARALRFYERNGFKRFGVQPRAILVEGVGQDDVFMVRMLDG